MMNNVRFAGQTQSAAQTRNGLYEFSKQCFSWSGRVQAQVDAFAARKANAGPAGKVQAGLVRVFGGFASKLLDAFDYREFVEIPIKNRTLKILSPPIGALAFILLFCTIGSRVYYAWKRGKKENDYREIGDILRRDIPAISAFLFLLGPLTVWMNKRKRGTDGLDLVDPNSGKLLQYSQLKNYRLDNPAAIEAIIREGNGKGFANAMAFLNEYAKHPELKDDIALIQKKAQELAATPANQQKKIRRLALELHPVLQRAEDLRAAEVAHLGKMGAKVPSHLKEDILNVVVRYGKTRRLPVDVLSFAITLGVIGWLPIWFNEMWTRKKYEEEQMKLRAADLANYNPYQVRQGLYQTSRLAQEYRARYHTMA